MRSNCSAPRLRRGRSKFGYSFWRHIWAAWCSTCRDECVPFPSGRCGWCDSRLDPRLTRSAYEPPLTERSVAARVADGVGAVHHLDRAA